LQKSRKLKRLCLSFVLLFTLFFQGSSTTLFASATVSTPILSIKWQPWSDDVFRQAKAEHKLIVLDLHAVWCHWCHVMDEKTYQNPSVIEFINKYFIPVSVDQDARPDLSSRYQDYGWPATVIFNSDGKEREILSGYSEPEEFLTILKDCVKHPEKVFNKANRTPVSYSADTALGQNLKDDLIKRYLSGYDTENGGWTYGHKFLPADNVEYAMIAACKGDIKEAQKAKGTLNLQNNLLDPVWGGMYQYSTDNDWRHPHYEKIMSVQTDNLRIYNLAYLVFQDPNYLKTAKSIYQFMKDFLLSPDGAFYTSQDADLIQGQHSQKYFALNDQSRRKLGIPKIDKHIYSRENGWVIEALTYLYAASGDQNYLDSAIRCANWIIANRSDKNGFVHEIPSDQSYLGDNLSMGKAFLSLYAATGDRAWLDKAQSLADFIGDNFALPAGFATTKSTAAASDTINLDENIATARFYNLLYHYTGQKKDKDWAAVAMRYIATPAVSDKLVHLVCGLLLADYEVTNYPFHIVIVGSTNDPEARKLFIASQKCPFAYKQIEWLDMKEGALPGQSVEYPTLPKPAAFTCTNSTCSSPLYTVEKIDKLIENKSH